MGEELALENRVRRLKKVITRAKVMLDSHKASMDAATCQKDYDRNGDAAIALGRRIIALLDEQARVYRRLTQLYGEHRRRLVTLRQLRRPGLS